MFQLVNVCQKVIDTFLMMWKVIISAKKYCILKEIDITRMKCLQLIIKLDYNILKEIDITRMKCLQLIIKLDYNILKIIVTVGGFGNVRKIYWVMNLIILLEINMLKELKILLLVFLILVHTCIICFLIFTLLEIIIKATNDYGDTKSAVWKHVYETELDAFIGITLYIGLIKLPRIRAYC